MSSVNSKKSEDVKIKKKAVPKIVRDLAWSKWIGEDVAKAKCFCCGVNEIRMNAFHCGHIIAEVNGGTPTVDNLRPICPACNLSMGTENLEDFKKRCGFGVAVTPVPVAAPAAAVSHSENIVQRHLQQQAIRSGFSRQDEPRAWYNSTPVVEKPSPSEVVAWYPGLILQKSPKYVVWVKGTNSLDMSREMMGRYTRNADDIYVRNN